MKYNKFDEFGNEFYGFIKSLLESAGFDPRLENDNNGEKPHIFKINKNIEIFYDSQISKQDPSQPMRSFCPGSQILFKNENTNTLKDKLYNSDFHDVKNTLSKSKVALLEGGNKEIEGSISSILNLGKDLGLIGINDNHRMLIAGLPGTGKSTVVEAMHDLVILRQTEQLKNNHEKCANDFPVRWQLPLMLSGTLIREIGIQRAINEKFQSYYHSQVPYEVLVQAIRCGYLFVIVDTIDDWLEDDRLTPSTTLLAEFLSIIGKNGRFALTVDARFIYLSLLERRGDTDLGERFREAEDLILLRLAPVFDPEGGIKAFDKLRNNQMYVKRQKEYKDYMGAVNSESNEWLGKTDIWGIFGPARRRSFAQEISRWMFVNSRTSIPFGVINDIVFDTIPQEFQETFYIEQVIDDILNSTLFSGTEAEGLKFASQVLYEAILTERFAQLLADRIKLSEFINALREGQLYDRLACHIWLHPDIKDDAKMHYSRLSRELKNFNEAGIQGRNLCWNLIILIKTYHLLFINNNETIDMPSNASLRGFLLAERDFSGLMLKNWNFDESTLSSSRFIDSRLEDCSFRGSFAPSLTVIDTEIEGNVSFSSSRLSGALFSIEGLQGLTFSNADLSAAKFSLKIQPDKDELKVLFKNSVMSNVAGISRELDYTAVSGYSDIDIDLVAENIRESTNFYLFNKLHIRIDGSDADKSKMVLNDYNKENPTSISVEVEDKINSIRELLEAENDLYILASGDERWTLIRYNVTRQKVIGTHDFNSEVTGAAISSKRDIVLSTGEGIIIYSLDADTLKETKRFSLQLDGFLRTEQSGRFFGWRGKELIELELASGGELNVIDTFPIFATPKTLCAANRGDDVALAYRDSTVELISHRFGWKRRSVQMLSFEEIDHLVFSKEQPILYCIGHWKGEDPCSAVCIIDSRDGTILLYFPLEVQDEKSRQSKLVTMAKIRSLKPVDGITLEDLNTGFIDLTRNSAFRILNSIDMVIREGTFSVNEEVSPTIEMRIKEGSDINKLFKTYTLIVEKRQIALDIELAIHSPQGSMVTIYPNQISFESNEGEINSCSFKRKFDMIGDYHLDAQLQLGSYQRLITLQKPLQVRPNNPYIYTRPISDEWRYLFRGHEKMIDWVLKGFRNNHMSILGSRRQGKTSILLEIKGRMRKMYGVVPVYITLENIDRENASVGFIRNICSELYQDEEFRNILGFKSLPKVDNAADINSILREIGAALNDNYRRDSILVVLADEINHCIEWPRELSDQVRGYFSVYNWLRLISTGLPAVITKDFDVTKSSGIITLLLNNRYLQPLEHSEMKSIIEDPTKGRFDFSEDAKELAINLSSGRPYDLQVILYHAIEEAIVSDRTNVSSEDIQQAFDNELVPIYRSYLEPINTFEQDFPEAAAEWREGLKKEFDNQYERINSLDSIKKDFKSFYDSGYVRGRSGRYLNLPYAYIMAWLTFHRGG